MAIKERTETEILTETMARLDRSIQELTRLTREDEEPLTVEQAAAILKVEPSTVHSYVSQGIIPYSKLGDGERGPTRFWKQDVLDFGLRRRRYPAHGSD